jgi:hypothetical protein
MFFIIIISLWPHCWATGFPYGLYIKRTSHNPTRGPSASWWVLTTENTAGTNGLTCFTKHGGTRDNTFLVTHPMTDQCYLTSAIARRSALIAGLSSSSLFFYVTNISHGKTNFFYIVPTRTHTHARTLTTHTSTPTHTYKNKRIDTTRYPLM